LWHFGQDVKNIAVLTIIDFLKEKSKLAFSKKIKCLKELRTLKISYGIEMEINDIDTVFADIMLIHFLWKPGPLLQLQVNN
jgi:hypothetical protein